MRNIVWTIIVVWVVWKIYNAFASKAKNQSVESNTSSKRKEGEVKIDKNIDQQSHFRPNDGEFVDYEEVN